MIFKDRIDAGKKLSQLLAKKIPSDNDRRHFIVISLLRGGVVVGDVIAKKFSFPYLALPVAKIPAPHQSELAIGALCFDNLYLENSIIRSLTLSPTEINQQKQIAQDKFNSYCQRFNIKKRVFSKIKNKNVLLVDDGIATGSTAHAACLFLKNQRVKKVIFLSPVGPTDFNGVGFDEVIIFHKDPSLSAISQFYQTFPQVEDEEVRQILQINRSATY